MSDTDSDLDPSGEIVSVRGNQDGLVFRIDGRAKWEDVKSELEELLHPRQKFFTGGTVALEWLERIPTKEQSQELENLLSEKYSISVVRPKPKISITESVRTKSASVSVISGGQKEIIADTETKKKISNSSESFNLDEEEGAGGSLYSQMSKILGDELFYEDDANARVVYGTLRSGQRIETPFSLVVIGDVNPGADIIAGGDIYVLGALRGTAHAAAYDEYSEDRVIMAMVMQPVQLRIGSVISRGSDEAGSTAEVARLESRRIIVEEYNSRSFFWRKR